MNDLLSKLGMTCKRGYKLQVCQSNAGYYVGTIDNFNCPNCRLSAYGASSDEEVLDISRDYAMEIEYCSKGDCEFNYRKVM